jgi:hypothetical protein
VLGRVHQALFDLFGKVADSAWEAAPHLQKHICTLINSIQCGMHFSQNFQLYIEFLEIVGVPQRRHPNGTACGFRSVVFIITQNCQVIGHQQPVCAVWLIKSFRTKSI